MAEQGVQVSKARVGELLTNQYLSMIAQLQQQVAELTAVNEALMGRLNEHSNYASAPSPNGQALSRGIDEAPQST